jgi:hypothetical protein
MYDLFTYYAYLGGVLDCSGATGQMVRGFPGSGSGLYSAFELESVAPEQLAR